MTYSPFHLLRGEAKTVPGVSVTKLGHTEEVDNDRLATNAFAALLVIAFYYLGYRYPLRINSSTTSPTYSDTPGWLQVGKYLLKGLSISVP